MSIVGGVSLRTSVGGVSWVLHGGYPGGVSLITLMGGVSSVLYVFLNYNRNSFCISVSE